MKVVRLIAENVKRIKLVNIEPGDASLITIGGKNSAGKSSVLDAVAYAMGGAQLVPSEPIRVGEAEAKIVVDLGDLVVTRKFRRDIIHQNGCDTYRESTTLQVCTCKPDFGDTTSTLTVTNKDGAKYPSPQAVIDALTGKLTFDPLVFARAEPKEQDVILRKLVNLDVTPIEARRKTAFDQRAMLKKSHAIKAAQLAALPFVKDAPEKEIPMEAIADEMRKAEEYRRLAEDAERQVTKIDTQIANSMNQFENIERDIALVDKQIASLNEKREQTVQRRVDMEISIKESEASLDAAKITAQAARAVVPDASVIQTKIKNTEIMNAAVRGNQKYIAEQAEVEGLLIDIDVQHQAILGAESEKLAALLAAQFPVSGLGLGDDGVTFNALPFSQAGSAEQVRVSVAIGIALNPQLKVLLIRNGNLLDKDSLAAVAAQAEAAGMQVWMEYVSESKDGVAVMLVDGEVA